MKRRSRLRRFLSINQHRKRYGAGKYASENKNYTTMRDTIISLEQPAKQTRGADKSLHTHLQNLQHEFAGQSELLWHHAKLIVLIRREFQTAQKYAEFYTLWKEEGAFLRKNLNVRWLISATDTFADHDIDANVRSAAMITSMLVNTMKMYESERLITHSQHLPVDPLQVDKLQEELVPLFEGMSCFTVGTDDTLRNMVWRLQPFMKIEPTGLILKEVWDRLQVEDTIFHRMRNLHRREKTRWW